MPTIKQVHEAVAKMREGLALIDKQRAVIIEAIRNGEDLINKMERAGVKA